MNMFNTINRYIEIVNSKTFLFSRVSFTFLTVKSFEIFAKQDGCANKSELFALK